MIHCGKIHAVYASGDRVLLAASDRIPVSGCVLPDPIPGKGRIVTGLSAFWFQRLDFVPNHFITADFAAFPNELKPFESELAGRALLARRTQPLPIHCVIRGHLAGEAWDEYRAHGTVGGQKIPDGLQEAARLPSPLFIPGTRAENGAATPITREQFRRLVGDELAHRIREESFEIYDHGRAHARRAGIILADTSLEFGLLDGDLILIGDCLTPDSSHFWAADQWEPGRQPVSFAQQFVHDHLAASGWNRQPPAPHLPAEIIARTAARYREIYDRLAVGRRPA